MYSKTPFLIRIALDVHSKTAFVIHISSRTIWNGWSRDVLRNWLSTDLYESEGKAPANFAHRVCISSSTCEIPGSVEHTGLLKVGDMSFKLPKEAGLEREA